MIRDSQVHQNRYRSIAGIQLSHIVNFARAAEVVPRVVHHFQAFPIKILLFFVSALETLSS